MISLFRFGKSLRKFSDSLGRLEKKLEEGSKDDCQGRGKVVGVIKMRLKEF